MRQYLLLPILLSTLSLPAQSEFQWFYGTSQSDQGICAEETQDGGFVISANSFGDLLNTGSVNNLLIKVNDTGSIQWVHAADTNSSNETSIVVEDLSDSSFVVASYTEGSQLVNYPRANGYGLQPGCNRC